MNLNLTIYKRKSIALNESKKHFFLKKGILVQTSSVDAETAELLGINKIKNIE